MRTNRSTCVGLIALALNSAAGAQILPPVPPAALPTPPYTPPLPPPLAPAPPDRPEPKPADAEKPLPSIITRDSAGKLRRPDTSPEEAALAKMELPAEQRTRIDAVLAARRADISQMVVDKLEAVLEARKAGATIDQIRDMSQLMKIKDTIQAIAPEKPLDRLLREGAITPIIKSRVEQVVREYNDALTAERQADSGSDFMKIAQFVAGDVFRAGTRDAFTSLDAMLASAAKTIEVQGSALNLAGPPAEAFTRLQPAVTRLDASTPADLKRRIELTRAFFFDELPLAAQRDLLARTLAGSK